MKYFANEDREITITAIPIPQDIVDLMKADPPGFTAEQIEDLSAWKGKGTLINTLSTKNNAENNTNNKKVCINNIAFTPLNCTLSNATWVSGNSNGIDGTTTKCFDIVSGKKTILREGDMGTCNGTFTITSPPFTLPCSCTLIITDAGQDKVSGD
jgi:hypothetical protein